MLLPTPLCYLHISGWSYSDHSVATCFVKWGEVKDVPSGFSAQGQRVGGQTGYYGAYVNESSIDIGAGMVDQAWINQHYPYGVQLSLQPTMTSAPCPAWWQDGEHQYATSCFLTCRWTETEVGGRYIGTAKVYVYTGPFYRAALSSIQAVDTTPGRTWYNLKTAEQFSRQYVDELDTITVEADTLDGLRSAEQDAHLHSPLWSMCMTYARMYARNVTWQPYQLLRQSIYRPQAGSTPDYEKLFSQLIHTYEFSDPQLANGLVASETHYRTLNAGDTYRGEKLEDQRNQLVCKGGPFGTYTFEWLVQHAWYDAVSSIPQANQNSIQNLMAAFELLAGLMSGDLTEIPEVLWDQWVEWTKDATHAAKAVSDLWMTYRYEYSTTKMDIDEYVAFGLDMVDRYMQQITSSRTHGHASRDGYSCNCSMTWSEKGLTGLSQFFHSLYKSGLEPNAYVLWDFVPFSFVADWFFPIGDVLQVYSDAQYRNEAYYDFRDIVFSISYDTGPIAGITASHYVRWVAERPPILDHAYWFDDGSSSTGLGTIFKRVLDSGCLMSGRVLK